MRPLLTANRADLDEPWRISKLEKTWDILAAIMRVMEGRDWETGLSPIIKIHNHKQDLVFVWADLDVPEKWFNYADAARIVVAQCSITYHVTSREFENGYEDAAARRNRRLGSSRLNHRLR